MSETKTMPVQVNRYPHERSGAVRAEVYLRAYEVYAAVHGEQKAMVEGGCRGGFAVSELIAFLYARSFPKAEWSARCDEAFTGMKNIS